MDEAFAKRLLEPNAEFEAWTKTLDPKHWARYDLGACRLGWESARAVQSTVEASAFPVSVTERQLAWASLRMIAEAIQELFGLNADLESEEASLLRGPEYPHFAEGIVEALKRIRSALPAEARHRHNAPLLCKPKPKEHDR